MGTIDLLKVFGSDYTMVYSQIWKRPMHFFGLIGTVMLSIGFLFSIYLGVDKLLIDTSGRLITERPEFYIALATMIMGSQFFLLDFWVR